jgi:hypothetical protein
MRWTIAVVALGLVLLGLVTDAARQTGSAVTPAVATVRRLGAVMAGSAAAATVQREPPEPVPAPAH